MKVKTIVAGAILALAITGDPRLSRRLVKVKATRIF
jgi:hypothetical protein